MMDYIPRSDEKFDDWQNELYEYVNTRYGPWNIPEPQVQALNPPRERWAEALAVVKNPLTKTPSTVKVKDDARAVLETTLRVFEQMYLAKNPQVSDADRVAMNIPVIDKKPTPVPPPTSAPEIEITTKRRELTVHFHDEGKDNKAKPKGVHGAEIRSGIRTTPPTNIDDLTASTFATRTPKTFEYTEEQRGSTVYFCLRWENTTGKKGPWSEIVKAIVP